MRNVTAKLIVKMAKRQEIARIIDKNGLSLGEKIKKFEAKKNATLMTKLLGEAQKDGMTIDDLKVCIKEARRMMSC